MGDLNIPGEVPKHYQKLLTSLTGVVDLWTVAGNEAGSGFTLVANNNFYEDEDDEDKPHTDQRLDYVLLRAGHRFVPILAKIDILKFEHNGRFISDHFGLRSVFGAVFEIKP